MIKSKLFGTLLIVAGTTIGASMLALPLKTAEVGFGAGAVFMAAAWLFMLANSFIILRVTGPYPPEATFHTIVKDVFGVPGWGAMTTAVLWLFYALLAAYASGASALIAAYVGMSQQLIGTLIFGVLSLSVMVNTAFTDHMNRWMFIVKLIIFAAILWPLCAQIQDGGFLSAFEAPVVSPSSFMGVLLIFITSFGFHGSITSLVNYNDGDYSRLRWAFFWGTLLSIVIYLVWIFVSLALAGQEVAHIQGMSDMIQYMALKAGQPWISVGLNLFAILAVLTSFLGVGLGLSNYFRDMLSQTQVPFKKGVVGCLTFVPPYLIMMIDPNIFVQALEFAGVALVFIAVLMPNLILQRQIQLGAVTCPAWVRAGSGLMILSALALIPLYFMASF